jgi:predicted ArsR family transcriptional regulator
MDIVEQDSVEDKRGRGRPVGTFKVKDKSSFLKVGGHELDKAIKQAGKATEEMIAVLMELALNKDVEPKERRMAAQGLLDMHVKMVDIRSKDEITRKIAEVKVRGVSNGGETDEDLVELDFDNIDKSYVQE